MRKVFFCLVILFAFIIMGCSLKNTANNGNSGDCPNTSGNSQPGPAPVANPDWDKPFGTPQYLIHLTGHGTMDGSVKDDSYLLFPNAPDSKGGLLLPDGAGGTFGYSTDSSQGPFNTPREVCAAGSGKLGDGSYSAWNSNYSFSCKEMAAASGNSSGSSSGAGSKCNPQSPTDTPLVAGAANTDIPEPTDTDTPQVADNATPAPVLTAWLSCGDSLELEPSTASSPEMGAICGIFVKGWNSNTANRVQVTFPDMQNGFGRLPGGITVGPGNTSEDPGNMFGTSTDPNAYYFSEIYHAPATPPTEAFSPIRIIVSQEGGGQVTLLLNVKLVQFPQVVFGVCPAARSAALSWRAYGDAVGQQTFGADGVRDGVFQLDLTAGDPQSVVTYVRLDSLDSALQLDGLYTWDTQPAVGRRWYLALVQSTTNQLINMPTSGDVNLSVPGSATVFLFAEDNGYLVPGKSYVVTVYYGHHADCYSQSIVTIP